MQASDALQIANGTVRRIMVMVKVRGRGDYLPEYAGNLDIINCAAIAMAEASARHHLQGTVP